MSVKLNHIDEELLFTLGRYVAQHTKMLDERWSRLKSVVVSFCEHRDVSSYRIAQLTGVSQTTVNRWRREAGV